jgi:hypothetical protein
MFWSWTDTTQFPSSPFSRLLNFGFFSQAHLSLFCQNQSCGYGSRVSRFYEWIHWQSQPVVFVTYFGAFTKIHEVHVCFKFWHFWLTLFSDFCQRTHPYKNFVKLFASKLRWFGCSVIEIGPSSAHLQISKCLKDTRIPQFYLILLRNPQWYFSNSFYKTKHYQSAKKVICVKAIIVLNLCRSDYMNFTLLMKNWHHCSSKFECCASYYSSVAIHVPLSNFTHCAKQGMFKALRQSGQPVIGNNALRCVADNRFPLSRWIFLLKRFMKSSQVCQNTPAYIALLVHTNASWLILSVKWVGIKNCRSTWHTDLSK